MIEKEQIKLMGQIRKRFKDRSKKWCSGYLHGILDEAKRKKPDRAYTGTTRHDYNTGYVYGFIDARGTDVESEAWYKRLGTSCGRCIEPWWWRK